MKQITLQIPDKKYPFFLELIKNLGFAKLTNEKELSEEQEWFVEGTKHALEQVEQHLKGEIKLRTADQLYDEL